MTIEDTFKGRKYRKLTGVSQWISQCALAFPVIIACLWALEIHSIMGLLIFNEQFLALMLACGLVASFVNVRPGRTLSTNRIPWYDWFFSLLSIFACGYVCANYNWLVHELSTLTPERIVLGIILILMIAEATRRIIGWTLLLVVLFFFFYARFGNMMPGVLTVPSSSWQRIFVYSYLDSTALFGTPLSVAANTIVTFVLFGAVMRIVKGDTFITDIALVAMGRFRGGPAKVSVAASTLFGMVSGSAVSNVAVVGSISIPIMERAGYPKNQAAAIEAVSSTGGQIMPPVMGITAFLMADFLAIPYSKVVFSALLPALLYYVAVFVQIDLEAGKRGLKGVSAVNLPKLITTLKRGYVFIIPLMVLIYAVIIAYWPPGRAGLAASATALLVTAFSKRNRPSLSELWRAILSTGQTMMSILVLTAVAGIVIGALQLSGLGFSMTSILVTLTGDTLLLLLLMTGVICVILGMAMPTAVIYTMLAVLIAPALEQLGVERMAAHLFIFYMGMLSMITPPVCFATFTAAAIARSDFWPTALSGMQYGIAAYILPFIFPFSPGLLMVGSLFQVTLTFLTAILGIFGIAASLVGFLFRGLNTVFRILFFIFGCAVLISPFQSVVTLLANIVGIVGGGLIFIYEWMLSRQVGELQSVEPTPDN